MNNIIKKSYTYLKKYKYKLLLYYLLTLTMSTISVIYPQIIGKFTDILIEKNIQGLYKYILFFISFNLINLLFTYISGKLYIYIQAQSAYKFNKEVNTHVWNIPILKSAKYDSAYLADRINTDTNSIIIFSINAVQTGLSTIISVGISSAFMIRVDKSIFLIALLASILYCSIYILLRDKIYKVNRLLMDSKSQFASGIFDQLSNIRSLKIHGFYDRNLGRLDESFSDLLSNTLSTYNLNYVYSFFDDFISHLSSIIFFIYGGISVIKGQITIGQYISLNSYLMVLMSSSATIFSLAKETKLAKVAFDRVDELSKIDLETNSKIRMNDIDEILINFTFAYPDHQKNFQYNYKLDKGKIYKLVGDNGAGKTTLIDNIIGLYIDTYEGDILYNGIDIRNIDMKYMRKYKISYVDQKLDLGSLDKIDRTDEKELYKIILENDQEDLVDISDREIFYEKSFDKMSGGQMRKVQIYNEVFKDSSLMILDEPANYLDKKSIGNLRKLLLKISRKQITIIVDHDNKFDDIVDEIIYV
ncbi:MAG: ABC transporter ATP-binding protein [Anaerococcus sp.]|nr:ABC transporter ATP-binding protein [Anaerococcus sp.]